MLSNGRVLVEIQCPSVVSSTEYPTLNINIKEGCVRSENVDGGGAWRAV